MNAEIENSPSGKVGTVYLVGAGPGDPSLITVRGATLLAAADVVVYDYLSNPALLGHAPTARTLYVGKQAASHSMSQDQINQLLVDLGRQGLNVVRLKGGDPFVFGRGGEECEALLAAGIPYEVVPGITAAIAAAAYAGIPITHRDFNSSFTLITGHEKEEPYRDAAAKERDLASGSSDLDWPSIAKLPCVAFYMGVKSLERICQKLMDHGKPPTTPAATIQWGTTTRQRTVVGTLADLPAKIAQAKLGPPAITVVGQVVSLREKLAWFERRPLFGQTIAVTRTRQQVSELTQRLTALGASVIEAPTIELVPNVDPTIVDHALERANNFDWIIFTSANGVRFTKERLLASGRDIRALGNAKIAAIGEATARAIRDELCLSVALCPESFVAEALAAALIEQGQVRNQRFLLLRAEIARPILRQKLEEAGAAAVEDVPIYQTQVPAALPVELVDALKAGRVDWVTFTSSSTAANLVKMLGESARPLLGKTKLASIGPVTTATLEELDLKPALQASVYTIEGLVEALCDMAQRTKPAQ